MGVAIPALKHSACCCCGCRASVGSSGGGSADFLGSSIDALAGGISPGVASSDPLSWRRDPRAGVPARVPVPLYRALRRSAEEPVLVRSRCGRDRDCVGDDRIVSSFQVAERGAYPWIAKGNGRFVDILTQPGAVLLLRMTGSEADYVQFTPNDRDETEMRAIQKSPNSGRFGFLPE